MASGSARMDVEGGSTTSKRRAEKKSLIDPPDVEMAEDAQQTGGKSKSKVDYKKFDAKGFTERGGHAMGLALMALIVKAKVYWSEKLTKEKWTFTEQSKIHAVGALVMFMINNISHNPLKSGMRTGENLTILTNKGKQRIAKSYQFPREKLRDLANQALRDARLDPEDPIVRAQIHIYGQATAYAEDYYNQALGTNNGGQFHADLGFQKAGAGIKGPARVNLPNFGGVGAILGQILTNLWYSKGWGNPFNPKIPAPRITGDQAGSLRTNVNLFSARIPEGCESSKVALGGFLDEGISRSQSLNLYNTLCGSMAGVTLIDFTPMVPPLWTLIAFKYDDIGDIRERGAIHYVNVAARYYAEKGIFEFDDIVRSMITTFLLAYQDRGVVENIFGDEFGMKGWITYHYKARGVGKFTEFEGGKGSTIIPQIVGLPYRVFKEGNQQKPDTETNTMFHARYKVDMVVDYQKGVAWKPRVKSGSPIVEAMIEAVKPAVLKVEIKGAIILNDGKQKAVTPKGDGLIHYGEEINKEKRDSFNKMKIVTKGRVPLKNRVEACLIDDELIPNAADYPVPKATEKRMR